jgi:hypothetical protein
LSIYQIEDIDSLSLKHLNFINSYQVIYDFELAKKFFKNEADYTNYFHKRYLFVYFYISPPNFERSMKMDSEDDF